MESSENVSRRCSILEEAAGSLGGRCRSSRYNSEGVSTAADKLASCWFGLEVHKS